MTNTAKTLERELTLVVISPRPTEILFRLASADRVGSFVLGPPVEHRIRDRYLDTPAHRLSLSRWALRIRGVGDAPLLTLKGPSRVRGGGDVERFELELPYTVDGFYEVLRVLSDRRIGVRPAIDWANASLDTLPSHAGFEVIQDRETLRVARSVRPEGQRIAIAELALDRVTYHIDALSVIHYEVEIEADAAAEGNVIPPIAAALRTLFPDELRPWPFGKLATGQALVELEQKGDGLVELVHDDGMLRASAYEVLRRMLAGA